MTDFGTVEATIDRAQNMSIRSGTIANGVTNNTYVLLRGIRLETTPQETRTDHGTKVNYGYAIPDRSLRFLISGSSDVHADIFAKAKLDVRNVLPTYKWEFKLTSDNNVTKTLSFDGKLMSHTLVKRDDTSKEPSDIECNIRIIGEITLT